MSTSSPEFGAPVAQDVNVNPLQGIQTLSGLLGLKQQQLGIQQQQQQLQTQTAVAQQTQQQTQEQQALAQFTVRATKDPAYFNPDGSWNVTKYQRDASAVAPVYGQQYIGQLTSNATEAVDNRDALLKLSNDQRTTVSQYFSTLAQKPNATTSDYLDTVERARSVSNDPGYQRALDYMLLHAPQTGTLTSANASATFKQYAGLAPRAAATVTAPGASAPGGGAPPPSAPAPTAGAGTAAPRANAPLSPQQVDAMRLASQQYGNPTNAPQYAAYTGKDSQTHYAQVNPNAPGGMRADIGTTLPQGMTPSERYSVQRGPGDQLVLTDRQSGRMYSMGPAASRARQQPPGPAAQAFIGRDASGRVLTSETDPNRPGINAPGASWDAWKQSVAQAQSSVQGAREADAQYGNQMAIADQVRRLSEQTKTGPGTPEWNRTVGLLTSRFGGSHGVTNVQTLESFLDRQAATMREGMGLPQTNAGEEAARVIGGNVGMQGGALRAKNDYNEALAQGLHDYRTGLDHVEGFTGDASPSAVNRFKAQWAANYDPLAYEYKLAKERGDTAAVAAITNRLTPAQARTMLAHLRATDRLVQGAAP